MKYSYKTIKTLAPFVESVESLAEDIIMHTAEVEGIELEGKNLKDVYIGKILDTKKHTDSEKLNICQVEVLGEKKQIICGAPNVKVGIKVPIAVVGAKLKEDFVIEKCKIRGEISEGMICSEDELGLKQERQEGIMILEDNAQIGISMREYLKKSDAIIEIDNKGINHRPDMFSHIGLARELAVINGKKFNINYEKIDFSKEKDIKIENKIPQICKRYIGLSLSGVSNSPSPNEIKDIINISGNTTKGILVDISNYSLYFYGQPTHCFDADKIDGNIIVRFAEKDEEFIALDNKTYKLSPEDIVIADKSKVLALGGVIGGKLSAVTDSTKNIVVEGAYFDPKTVRKTGRRHGIRTDSLNVFEKDIPLEFPLAGVSLIYKKLKENFSNLKIVGYSDSYPKKQESVKIPFDLGFINNLIGANYSEKEALEILERLGILLKNNSNGQRNLLIPFWRKDLNFKADIAEEIARIHGLNNVETTVPRVNLGAVIQDNIYKLKNDVREFFVDRGFFDLYNYSFVNENLMKNLGGDIKNLISLKNSLSEEMTHMRGSLIPNLILSTEKNIRQYQNLKLFEFEKVFLLKNNKIEENYNFAGVVTSNKDLIYYDLQKIISDLFKKIQIDNFMFIFPQAKTSQKQEIQIEKANFDKEVCSFSDVFPTFAHKGRTSSIIVRGQEIGFLGEIHPAIANNFSIKERLGFFEINANKLKDLIYNKVKAKEVSSFQENNFDLSFVVSKEKAGKDIMTSISKTDPKLIQKVELFDIYENEEKLPGKRSLSFKIYIQSLEETLSDEVKNKLIKSIIEKVGKIGGELR